MRVFPGMVIGALLYSSFGFAEPTVVPDPIPCVSALEKQFFQPMLVNQALNMYHVRQEIWPLINQSLQQLSLEVPDRMKKRTAFMVPNPIEYPMNNAATAKILKEVLAEVFLEAVRRNYAAGPEADLIFDYIFSQQLPEFIRCFGPAAKELQPKF